MAVPPNFNFIVFILILTHLAGVVRSSSESESLINFKKCLTHKDVLFSWNATTPPCTGKKANWVGILCDINSHVIGIRLEGMKLSGYIEVDALKELQYLRSLSLMDNNFEGTLPKLSTLGMLKTVYLSNNKFSGEIDAVMFERMLSLKKLYVANNEFTGLIPLSLITLPRLAELSLEGNQFSGEIPPFINTRFRVLNLSNNHLEGAIPRSISKVDASSFSGNNLLCGPPLTKQCRSSTKLPLLNTILFVITLIAAIIAIGAVFVILKKKKATNQTTTLSLDHGKSDIFFADSFVSLSSYNASQRHTSGRFEGYDHLSGKLVFFKDDHERFELPDLLKSSAEVLGSGYFGASYKAGLSSGKNMVVKRFKYMNNVGREEFHEHIFRLGRINHPNLLPPVAFYYRKEEKLLVYEYVNNVSLALHLHGNRALNEKRLNWAARLNIIKGVAKGLQHLYNEFPNLVVPHGHLKSSNVLLTETMEPLITDYSLIPMVNVEHAQEVMIAYKSPEYKHNHRVTKKTDVWSLGILIIETLTGKFPTNHFQHGNIGNDPDLVTWVRSKDQEDFSDIFDKDMGVLSGGDDEEEMVKLLNIGLACAESDVDKRYDIREAVEKIEGLKSNCSLEVKQC